MSLASLRLLPICMALSCAGLAAQTQTFVSPIVSATSEGKGSNGFPFTSSTQRRYIQIHSDLPTMPMKLTALGVRITESSTVYTGSCSIDMELFMGVSQDWNACSFLLDKIWLQPKTQVVNRKIVVFGPGVGAVPGPSPFVPALQIPLDTPYLRIPLGSLAWEIHVHSNATGSIGTIDAETCSTTAGTVSKTGSGCTATGQASPMDHGAYAQDRAGTLLLILNAKYCPANAACFLMLGLKNPALTIPGRCAGLHTDMLVGAPFGQADGVGDLHIQGTAYYYGAAGGAFLVANFAPGAKLFTQVLALDMGQPVLPAALSNGNQITLPMPDMSRACAVNRLFNNTGGLTEPMSTVFTTSTVGYGLPTQFVY